MNFLMSLVHIRASLSPVIEHYSAESEGLRCNLSWELRIFLSHTCDKTIKCLSLKEDQVLRFT